MARAPVVCSRLFRFDAIAKREKARHKPHRSLPSHKHRWPASRDALTLSVTEPEETPDEMAASLGNDKFLRALGVKRAASVQWASASPQTKAIVSAYTAGINAYLSGAMKARPPEFVVLGLQPEPWTPEDTLAWGIMMAWDLGANWSTELLRMRLALTLPVERINELLPPYPGEKPLATADYAALFRELRIDGKLGTQALNFAPESGIEGVGSNNWVVHGSHTESGKPLLA